MTRDKGFKRLARARASATGERYTMARQSLLRQGKESRMVPVTCEVRTKRLSEERLRELREEWEARRSREIEEAREQHPEAVVMPPFSEEMGVMALREIGGERDLEIWCGHGEAIAVALGLKGVETQRPMTHDLLRDVVGAMGSAREVHITDLRDGTFYAELIVVDTQGKDHAISSRPSDGIAFAVRTAIPILVAEHLFEAAKV